MPSLASGSSSKMGGCPGALPGLEAGPVRQRPSRTIWAMTGLVRDSRTRIHPLGNLRAPMLAFVAWFAQEKSRIKERQRAGITAARNNNGGKCPWGGSAKGRRLKVTAEKEALILKLHQEGQSTASYRP